MKTGTLVCAALACVLPGVAQAQTTTDDVRCLLVSTSFARMAKDDNLRRTATMTGAFYLGRINGRLSPTALAAAIRAQGKGLPAQQAEPVMRACAARAAVAEQQLTAAGQQAGLGK